MIKNTKITVDDLLQNNRILKSQYLDLKSDYKCYIESLVVINLFDKLKTTDEIDTNKLYLQQLLDQDLNDNNEEEFENVYYMLNGLTIIIGCDSSFPLNPPKIKLGTKIYHPNVDNYGIMKFTLIDSEWCPVITLRKLVETIKQILSVPDLKTYNNKEALLLYNNDKMQYYKKCVEYVIDKNTF